MLVLLGREGLCQGTAKRLALESGGVRGFGSKGLRMNFERRALFVDRQEVHWTPLEGKVLLGLARRCGGLVTEHQLVRSLWGKGAASRANHLRACVRRLREKMERDPSRPEYLGEDERGFRLRLS